MKNLIKVFFCVTLFYSCSLNDFFEPNSTFKESIVVDNFLYQVESDLLTTFDISDPEKSIFIDEKKLTSKIESLTSFGGVLFVGVGGVLISYTIDDQGIPIEDNRVSQSLFHTDQTICDPMIVNMNTAIVALKVLDQSEQECIRFDNNNIVLIYDIEDLTSPLLLNKLEFNDLQDIALANDILIIADGSRGFFIYDSSDPSNLIELYHITDMAANDIVMNDNTFIIANIEELRQYDYSDIENVLEISRIIL